MIIEFFGKISSGKSTLAENLEKEKKWEVIKIKSRFKKYLFSLIFTIFNPIKSFYLFKEACKGDFKLRKISLMIFNTAKYQKAKMNKGINILEEGFLQAIFSILDKTSEKKGIDKYLKNIPKSEIIILVDIDENERKFRLRNRKHNLPEKMFGKKYGEFWEKNMLKNYPIIEKAISKNFINILKLENSKGLKEAVNNLNIMLKDII